MPKGSKWIRKSEHVGNYLLDFCIKTDGGCLEWSRARSSSGHGSVWHQGKCYGAHRLSLILSGKPVPKGVKKPFACHTCDNPPCCNPDHLYWGDMSTNMRDAYKRGQKNHMLGEECGTSVLSGDDVRKIRCMLKDGMKKSNVARAFSVSHSAISHIAAGRSWRHLDD